ncbi:RNA polymerase Rpb1, domain 1 family protein, partial [Chlamydia psittaci 06-1683]
GSRGCSI